MKKCASSAWLDIVKVSAIGLHIWLYSDTAKKLYKQKQHFSSVFVVSYVGGTPIGRFSCGNNYIL